MLDHTELYKQFEDDPSFKQWLGNLIFNATYQPHQGKQFESNEAVAGQSR